MAPAGSSDGVNRPSTPTTQLPIPGNLDSGPIPPKEARRQDELQMGGSPPGQLLDPPVVTGGPSPLALWLASQPISIQPASSPDRLNPMAVVQDGVAVPLLALELKDGTVARVLPSNAPPSFLGMRAGTPAAKALVEGEAASPALPTPIAAPNQVIVSKPRQGELAGRGEDSQQPSQSEAPYQVCLQLEPTLQIPAIGTGLLSLASSDIHRVFTEGDENSYSQAYDTMEQLAAQTEIEFEFYPKDSLTPREWIRHQAQRAGVWGRQIRPDAAEILALASWGYAPALAKALVVARTDTLDIVVETATHNRQLMSSRCMASALRHLAYTAAQLDPPGGYIQMQWGDLMISTRPKWFDEGSLIRKGSQILVCYLKSLKVGNEADFANALKSVVEQRDIFPDGKPGGRARASRQLGIFIGMVVGGALRASADIKEEVERFKEVLKDALGSFYMVLGVPGVLAGNVVAVSLTAATNLAIDFMVEPKDFAPAVQKFRGSIEAPLEKASDYELERGNKSQFDAAKCICWANIAIHASGYA